MEFLILLRSWLRLKIGTIQQLAKVSGFASRTIVMYVKGKMMMMSEFVADVLLTSMGVIEQKLMGCGK